MCGSARHETLSSDREEVSNRRLVVANGDQPVRVTAKEVMACVMSYQWHGAATMHTSLE